MATMLSSFTLSAQADDKPANDIKARASCVTPAGEVASSGQAMVAHKPYVSQAQRQTTAHRDYDTKRRDPGATRDEEVRNGTETKSDDGSGTDKDQWSPAAKTGLSPRVGRTAGKSAQSIPQERSSALQPVNSSLVSSSVAIISPRAVEEPTAEHFSGYRTRNAESTLQQPRNQEKNGVEYVSAEKYLGSNSNACRNGDTETNNDISAGINRSDATTLTKKTTETERADLQPNVVTGPPPERPQEDERGEPSSSDTSKDSEEDLTIRGTYPKGTRSTPNSNFSLPNSFVFSQYRRLESRRGSSVSFLLPAHVCSGDNSSQDSSRRSSICTEEGAQLRERFHNLNSRSMSAPELPPITDRDCRRPSSRSTNQSSISQLTGWQQGPANQSSASQLTSGHLGSMRLPTSSPSIPPNGSDLSLKGLTTRSQGPTRSSGSVSSYRSGGWGGMGGGGGEGGGVERGVERGDLSPAGQREGCLTPARQRSSPQALSWTATENSNGSVPRLETLFERKCSRSLHNSNNSLIVPGIPKTPQIGQHPHDMLPPRSVSVSEIRPSIAQELAKIKVRKKRLQSDCGAQEVEMVGTIEHFSRLRVNGMCRSASENKLVERRNGRNARVSGSRHISVAKTEKLTGGRKSLKRGGGAGGTTSNVSSTNGVMRRVNSIPAISVPERQRARLNSNRDSGNVDGAGSEDSEEEEERRERIREWLKGLDCADAPPEPVIEYADDPPQTDTAVHIVYQHD